MTKNADGTFTIVANGYQRTMNANGELTGEIVKVGETPSTPETPENPVEPENPPAGTVVAGGTATATVKDNYTDSNNAKATIPKGFTVSATENTISTGLVVIAPDTARSEFVWVPVDSNLRAGGTTGKEMAVKTNGTDGNNRDNYQGKLYDFTGTGDATTSAELTSQGQGTTYNREPSLIEEDSNNQYYNTILGYDVKTGVTDFGNDMQKDYNAMIESVKTYGGFYVGRYETSINGATVASIAGVEPMSADTDSGNMWYGMYKKQKDYASSNANLSSVKSSMIWGSQYDAMLNWALGGTDKGKVTATTNGNHDGSVANTGVTTNDKINNIYDLEGNVLEWTIEAYGVNNSSGTSDIQKNNNIKTAKQSSYVEYRNDKSEIYSRYSIPGNYSYALKPGGISYRVSRGRSLQ